MQIRLASALVLGLLSFATLLQPKLAHAGDAAGFQSLGFSSDGRYFAWMESGTHDGSGFPFASVTVVDTTGQTVIAPVHVVVETQNDQVLSSTVAERRALKQARLSKYGIRSGAPKGETLWQRLMTDFSPTPQVVFSRAFWAEGGASSPIQRFAIEINQRQGADITPEQYCNALSSTAPTILSARLIAEPGPEHETRTTLATLIDEQVVSPSFNCVFGYSARQVIQHKGALVVVFSYEELGFEGPNVRFRVVATQPSGWDETR